MGLHRVAQLAWVVGVLAVVLTQWIVPSRRALVSQCAMAGCNCNHQVSSKCCCHGDVKSKSAPAGLVWQSVPCGVESTALPAGVAKFDGCEPVAGLISALPARAILVPTADILARAFFPEPPVPPPRVLLS